MLDRTRTMVPPRPTRIHGIHCAVLRVADVDVGILVKLGNRLGVSLPAEPCHSNGSSPCALWLAPGEWLIVQDHPFDHLESPLERELAGNTFHLADVTYARVAFSVAVPAAIEILNRACSLDFHPRVFKPGQCVRTRFAQIPALIHLSPNGGEFRIYVDSSHEAYLNAWFSAVCSLLTVGAS